MKNYIECQMKFHPEIFPNEASVVEHMFAALGNGVKLNQKGFINENYGGTEAYVFSIPVPYKWIYPWCDTEQFQPFRNLAGCRDVGFKETAQYFIDCIKASPDSVGNIKEWKDNIHIVEDVLLNTPTIQPQYTMDDMDKFLDDIVNDKMTCQHPQDGMIIEPENSVSKIWFFDVQWSDCPTQVENEVRHLWSNLELGNDHYMYKGTLDEEFFDDYPNIYFWLKHNGVSEKESFIVHWWW